MILYYIKTITTQIELNLRSAGHLLQYNDLMSLLHLCKDTNVAYYTSKQIKIAQKSSASFAEKLNKGSLCACDG